MPQGICAMNHQGAGADKQELGLKNVKVFTTTDEIAGLPSGIFMAGLGMSIGLAVAVQWWALFIVAPIYYPAMYAIHKDDPKGFKVWMRAYQRKGNYWAAGKTKSISLQILMKKR